MNHAPGAGPFAWILIINWSEQYIIVMVCINDTYTVRLYWGGDIVANEMICLDEPCPRCRIYIEILSLSEQFIIHNCSQLCKKTNAYMKEWFEITLLVSDGGNHKTIIVLWTAGQQRSILHLGEGSYKIHIISLGCTQYGPWCRNMA